MLAINWLHAGPTAPHQRYGRVVCRTHHVVKADYHPQRFIRAHELPQPCLAGSRKLLIQLINVEVYRIATYSKLHKALQPPQCWGPARYRRRLTAVQA